MIYPETSQIKTLLSDLKSDLPDIPPSIHDAPIPTIWDAQNGFDRDSIFMQHRVLRDATQSLMTQAEAHATDTPYVLGSIRGYAGVARLGQCLTYIHSDPVPLRLTFTVADETCTVNPSTLVFPNAEYDIKLWETLTPLAKAETPTDKIPSDIPFQQVAEGGIAVFGRGQHHTEAVIPLDTAKLLIAATLTKRQY